MRPVWTARTSGSKPDLVDRKWNFVPIHPVSASVIRKRIRRGPPQAVIAGNAIEHFADDRFAWSDDRATGQSVKFVGEILVGLSSPQHPQIDAGGARPKFFQRPLSVGGINLPHHHPLAVLTPQHVAATTTANMRFAFHPVAKRSRAKNPAYRRPAACGVGAGSGGQRPLLYAVATIVSSQSILEPVADAPTKLPTRLGTFRQV